MGALDKIFDNFEMLYDQYEDFPEARAAVKNIFQYMEEKGIDMTEIDPYLSPIISEYERQGFFYGFRYAAALFLDGTLQYGCSKRS